MNLRALNQSRWVVWLGWTLANFVGGTIAYFLLWFGMPFALAIGAITGTGIASLGVLYGVVVGFFQYPLLRKHINNALLWIATSVFGWGVAGAILQLSTSVGGSIEIRMILTGLSLGTATGVAQWLILRRHTRRAAWWISSSIIGWVLGFAISTAVSKDPLWNSAVQLIGAGTTYGAITGIALAWLLPDSSMEASKYLPQ